MRRRVCTGLIKFISFEGSKDDHLNGLVNVIHLGLSEGFINGALLMGFIFLKIVSSEEFRDVSLNGFKQMDLSVNEITYLGVLIVSSEGFIDGSLVGISLG